MTTTVRPANGDRRGKVLVTGAGGFVGTCLCRTLARGGWDVTAGVRRPAPAITGVTEVALDLRREPARWSAALESTDAVVHAAARVHQMGRAGGDEAAFQEANVGGSLFVAEQAAGAGVRKLVYLSSVKVNGEGGINRAYRADDDPDPKDAYARSKRDAETLLADYCRVRQMELVIIRAPLVYGAGVRANFLRMMQLVAHGVPLPLGAISNRRSMISVWNLCEFIGLCLTHAAAPGTWMISDGADLSTPQLIGKLAACMNRRPRLFAVSPDWLRRIAAPLGFGSEIDRLCDSLQVDVTPARAQLGWSPALTVDEGLQRTVTAFLAARSR